MIAPTRALLSIKDLTAFDAAYRDHLASIGAEEIGRQFAAVSEAHEGRGLVLLCFEDVYALGELACHRRSFARWWAAETGLEVKELPR